MSHTKTQHILRIDASARRTDSVSRALGDEVVRRLLAEDPGAHIEAIDLADGMPHIDGDWVAANLSPADERCAAQRARLRMSDDAIATLQAADVVVLTTPIYNFSVPSVLRAWIDHICRAGLSFRYTEQGPQGLLRDRPIYLAMASGGVPFGSPADFASGYLKQVLGFVGITDVRLIGAERTNFGIDAALRRALDELARWLPDPELA